MNFQESPPLVFMMAVYLPLKSYLAMERPYWTFANQ